MEGCQRGAEGLSIAPLWCSRLPSPSAIMAVTRVLTLTPSALARAVNRACRLFGNCCLHCPLAPDVVPGRSAGLPNSLSVSR